ncbi:MAG: LysR family transcriptional regulator [Christensenellaceae bacterium]
MELRVLEYFLAVAREKNISAAAKALHLSQPTLSRQLRNLEESLGVTLFLRGKRQITLTEEGRILQKRAAEIVELVEKTTQEIRGGQGSVAGDLYIGGGESAAMHLIFGVIKEMQTEEEQVRIHLFSGNAEDVAEKLENGLLDFGLFIHPADTSAYDSIRLPVKDMWGVLMRKDSPLAEKEAITREDLYALPLIISGQQRVEKEISEWMGRDISALQIVGQYNLIYNASLLVKEKMGYALALGGLIAPSEENELLFRPLMPKLEAAVEIAWKKGQVFSKPAARLKEALIKKFG